MNNRHPDLLFLEKLNEAHQRYGSRLSVVAELTQLDPSTICKILKGTRRPSPYTLITLCSYGYGMDIEETNELLRLQGYPLLPLGKRK